MKVRPGGGGERRPAGGAVVPEDRGPVHAAPLSGAAPAAAESFAVGAVTRLPEGGGAPVAERAVLAAPGRSVDLPPGWGPLAP